MNSWHTASLLEWLRTIAKSQDAVYRNGDIQLNELFSRTIHKCIFPCLKIHLGHTIDHHPFSRKMLPYQRKHEQWPCQWLRTLCLSSRRTDFGLVRQINKTDVWRMPHRMRFFIRWKPIPMIDHPFKFGIWAEMSWGFSHIGVTMNSLSIMRTSILF